uniref:Uncharacterized protein n=1 Tax=Anguilla anguilla TaxID=7936 RepID=A0A0E9Q3Y3_ANGAN
MIKYAQTRPLLYMQACRRKRMRHTRARNGYPSS